MELNAPGTDHLYSGGLYYIHRFMAAAGTLVIWGLVVYGVGSVGHLMVGSGTRVNLATCLPQA